MSGLLDPLLNIQGPLVYLLVGSLVFVEDALFVGFVIPGETAAVLGGVAASLGHVQLWLMVPLVVLAAILGDTVGYECEWSNSLAHLDPAIWRYPRAMTTIWRAYTAEVDHPRWPDVSRISRSK